MIYCNCEGGDGYSEMPTKCDWCLAKELPRVVAWFSCGAASAVAAKMAIEKYGEERVEVVYCDTSIDEDFDNQRFREDVEKWLGVRVRIIASEKYGSIEQVFAKARYMSGIAGAPCTVELKKVPRFKYQRADDIHIFGLTADEQGRIDRFTNNNPDMTLDWVLRDKWLTKESCFDILRTAGLRLPRIYDILKNANCIGCVKAQSPAYWRKIAKHFPEVFERRAKQSRELGARLVKSGDGRIFLDELDLSGDGQNEMFTENISCGPECQGEPESKPCGCGESREHYHDRNNNRVFTTAALKQEAE